jgi:ElaB/YqjD/DUF883 family membrane-anchored ribosome-binding protein
MGNITDEQQQDEGMVKEAGTKAKEGLESAASAAGEKTGELRQQGSQKLQEQLDHRSTDVGTQAVSVAEALRGTTGDLREQGNEGAAGLAEQAAEKIEQLGHYLERMDGQSLMQDVQSFARRRPWALAGIGLVAGMIGARFAKASASGGSTQGGMQGGSFGQGALPPGSGSVGTYGAARDVYAPSPGIGEPPPAPRAADPAAAPLGRDPDRPEG